MALKILLADDSMIAQNMGRKILSDAGYDVIPVSNGAAAVKRLPDVKPDIVLLDVYMPGFTGLEVCEKIKNAPATAHVPVLLTVGKLEPFRPEDGMKVKADGVIVKPFEATDLVAVVAKLAERIPVAVLEPKILIAEKLPPAEINPGLEVVAPPAPVNVPAEVAASPALGEDFLNELAVEAPPAPEVSAELPIEIDFLTDMLASAPPVTEAPEVKPVPESQAPVPSAEIQAAVAGLDFLAPEAAAILPAATLPVAPASTESAAVDSEPELPPIEIYLEPVGVAEETLEEAPEDARVYAQAGPTPPVAADFSLPGLEPTILEAQPETEIAFAPGLVSDYNESPVQVLSETVPEPADAPAEEPPEFALFNSVLASDTDARFDDHLAATLEAYGAAVKIDEPRPEPPAGAVEPPASAEPASDYAGAAAPARITDTEIPDQSATTSPMATDDAIGLALEAMLSGGIEAFEMEEALPGLEASEQATAIASESPVSEPEELPATVDFPVELEPVPEEQPLEITLEPIADITEPPEPSPAPAEAAPAPVEPPAAPVVAPVVVCASPMMDESVAEQIVDHVLRRIRPDLVEEVKRLLDAR